ncbi:MAG: hypothetical protein RMX68_007020 [Aulosira sp. ZfuVER01]
MVLTPQQLEAMMPDASQLLSDEPEMESSLHYAQLLLLVTCLEWLWRDSPDGDSSASRNDYFLRITNYDDFNLNSSNLTTSESGLRVSKR